MSRRIVRASLPERLLYHLGFVRRRHYEDVCERYERLYRHYVSKRMETDRVVKRLQEEGVI